MIASMLQQLEKIRWSLFVAIIALCGLGIYNLESAARSSMPNLYLMQLVWVIIGTVVMLLVASLDYQIIQRFSYAIYAFICFLLIMVLLVGHTVKGGTRWLHIGPMNIQPSEMMKVALILFLANYLAKRENKSPYTIRSFFKPFNFSRPIALLLFITINWDNAAMQDPIGEFARWLKSAYNNTAPVIEEAWWFRLGIISILSMLFVFAIWTVYSSSKKQSAFLNEEKSPITRYVTIIVVIYLGLIAAVLYNWSSPFFLDPFDAVIRYLILQTRSGNAYTEFSPSYGLRIALLVFSICYFLLCLLAFKLRGYSGSEDVLAPVDWIFLPAALIIVEPDLGTTLILLAIAAVMVLYVGVRRQSLFILSITLVLASGAAWAGLLKDYQKKRIITFLDPEHDAKGAGYHSIQSLIAVGSGRVWGKGHGSGTQTQLRFLPEQHTDFAFSVWAEEEGFVGCIILLSLYLFIILSLLSIAWQSSTEFGALVVVGTSALMFWHMLVNVGMVLGMLPVVGVTLPLFSYGGSSLVTIMATIGLSLSVSVPLRTFKGRL